MQPVEAFVRNPVKVSVGVLLLVLFGGIALMRMPMQLTPAVETPTIEINTTWAGASPEEIEQEIVMEQEEQLKGVEGVRKMTSESQDSRGRITLEFAVGTNMDQALVKVKTRLDQVREYPEDADQPVPTTSNSEDRPIAWFILSAAPPSTERLNEFASQHPAVTEELSRVKRTENPGLQMLRLRNLAKQHPEVRELLPPPDLEVIKLRRFAEDEIEARFERVEGVSQGNVMGGLEDELQIIVDPEKLAARQLTLTEVRDVLRGQNLDVSAGDIWEEKRRWVVRTLGEFRSPEQVEMQLLAMRDGAPVFVRDVAEVRLGYKKPDGLVRRFGESTIAINCIREAGANVLDVMAELRQVKQLINEEILSNRGLTLTQVYDETEYIDSSVNLVKQNIFVGGALTMAVLMAFLHLGAKTLIAIPLIVVTAVASVFFSPWWFLATLALVIGAGFWFARGALIVGLAIPVSIIGTFLVLGALGRSLNVISLAGLAFAVGMLVDNAVVVLENIYRRYAGGESAVTAAVKGTQEVAGAVVSSTLTTIAVFLPVVFVEEQAGQLFRDIALAISAAVALSLIMSVTLIPTASARLFRGTRNAGRKGGADDGLQSADAAAAGIRALGGGAGLAVVRANDWIQRTTLRRLATIGVLVGAAALFSWLMFPRVEYLPTGNRNLVFGFILPPPGYNIDQLTRLGETVEEELRPYWDVDATITDEQLDGPAIDDFFFVVRGTAVFLGVRARDPLRSAELVPLLKNVGEKLPGAIATAKQSSLFESGLSSGRTIDVEVAGPEIEHLIDVGRQVMGQVVQLIPDVQARPIPSLDLASPEVHIHPKLVQSADMMIDASQLGFAVNALIDGAYVGDYFHQGKKIDLTLMGEPQYAGRTDQLAALPVATPLGQLVPLGALADVEWSSGPESISRRERVRAITIQVSPPADYALEDAMQLISDQIVQPIRESGQLEGGYRILQAGTADKLTETWQALRFNVGIALLITYLLMAALFESWLYPLVIILSVPLGAVGGILGLQILNLFVLQPLDVLTMLGFVVLIGTVVNNPILIVHQSLNHMRVDGMQPRQAILESVRTRIRPIFMTTTTTVLGLAPLVLFPGAGSELYRGLGSVVLGGLVVSTMFTLILVPTLFSVALDLKARLLGDHSLASTGELGRARAEPALPIGSTNGDEHEPASAPSHEFVRSSPDR